MSVKWDEPIEAVHEDGRVSRDVTFEGYAKSHRDAVMCWLPTEFRTYFGKTGEPIYPECGWHIRNVAQAVSQPRTAPSGGEVGPEVVGVLVEALAAMIYEGTHLSPCKPNGDHDCTIKADTLAEARGALARGRALLPEPIDPDLLIARQIASDVTEHDQDFAFAIRDGREDDCSEVRAALAAIKRGRTLEKEAGR